MGMIWDVTNSTIVYLLMNVQVLVDDIHSQRLCTVLSDHYLIASHRIMRKL